MGTLNASVRTTIPGLESNLRVVSSIHVQNELSIILSEALTKVYFDFVKMFDSHCYTQSYLMLYATVKKIPSESVR